jgi:3-phosphoinositide dependent protein kinase-1
MIFQCISGRFPFKDRSQYLMWEKVKNLDYEFPVGFDEEAQDLVSKILVSMVNLVAIVVSKLVSGS